MNDGNDWRGQKSAAPEDGGQACGQSGGVPPYAPPGGNVPPPYAPPSGNTPPPYLPPTLNDPVTLYRRGLRRELMVIVLVLAGYFMIQTTVSSAVYVFQMLFGGGFQSILQSAQSSIDPNTGQLDMSGYLNDVTNLSSSGLGDMALLQLVAVVLSFPIFFAVAGKRWFSDYVPRVNRRMTGAGFLQIFVVCMGAQLVFTIIGFIADLLLKQVGLSLTGVYETTMGMMQGPFAYAYIMILGPISEELIFRGAIMRKLEPYGANLAIVVSALLFGLYHMIIIQAVFAFLVGIILGYAAQRYSLKWAILLHILINSISVLLEAFIPNEWAITGIMAAFFIGALLILILQRAYIRAEVAEGRVLQPSVNGPEMGGQVYGDGSGQPGRLSLQPFRMAFSSVALILYICATVLGGIVLMLTSSLMG
jgi:membrane protease YdiL (CAAX protease family)